MANQFRMTRQQVLALGPCSKSKVPDFGRKKYFAPQDAFDAGVSVEDFIWLLGKSGHKWVAVKMALIYAQRVSRLNPDPRVQAAIDAGWVVVRNPDDKAARAAAKAARAAARAAEAARAARAAARAARAAARAAEAAAWAAWAAAWAAARAAEAAAWAADPIRWIDIFNEATNDIV